MAERCSICLNDKSVRNISFNQDGVCNFCLSYLNDKAKLTDYNKLNSLFRDRIENIKGKHKYDVAVGISGGKDSIFVLYELKYKYNLKMKAFTMNNGFLSDKAKANIDSIVKELEVEHQYINFDKEMLKKFYSYSVKKWLVPCIVCSYIGYASMINYASKIDAGMIVHGRSPEQMFRYYGKDVFSELIAAGLKPINEVNLEHLYGRLLAQIDDKLDKNLLEDVKNMLFADIVDNDFREFVAYFLYHPYNEGQIVDFLKKNNSWQVGTDYNHYDCTIHPATKYIYQCAEGRAHIMPELSFLVRDGQLSKTEARIILNEQIMLSQPKAEMDKLFQFIGKRPESTLIKAHLYNKVISKWKL